MRRPSSFPGDANRKLKMRKGRSRSSSPCSRTTGLGLVNQVLGRLACTAETSDLRPRAAVEGGVVEDQSEVTLGNRLRERTRAYGRDERVRVAVLELRLRDDIAGETVCTVIQAIGIRANRTAAGAEHVSQHLASGNNRVGGRHIGRAGTRTDGIGALRRWSSPTIVARAVVPEL